MSTATTQAEHPPIYGELVDELGDIPADVRAVAERVLKEAERAVEWTGTATADPLGPGS